MRRVPGPSYAGSEVDESKKLVGHYNQSSGLAVLVHGGMTIFFRYIGPQEWRETKSPTLKIECKGREFKALESFPDTICGKKMRTRWDRMRGGRERRNGRKRNGGRKRRGKEREAEWKGEKGGGRIRSEL